MVIKDFPNILLALRTALPTMLEGQTVKVDGVPTVLDGITAGTATPTDLDARAVKGYIRFSTIDDTDDGVTRFWRGDFDVFTVSPARGVAIAERIRGILQSERRFAGVIFDRVVTSGPKSVPWAGNQNVKRVLSTHRISTRR